ncbi:N-acetylglucosamine kinase [Ureibacillus aquaedulcis]|uniref:BadF/BadG/BcrA/BcrD ATPase family protein n=1 Tax=Ureibacillus aquaedulcis TaxID=3058421 RepID=A0ABT8GTF4_9BACL|nr:BadF/BadG/BcrA/BcrD ATPase family protein [Ureibacillus sp. BA0131]MDN4494694.1 BadF/BadG/BcrA/BcrD ATPase family protein [Ureibacillus sp. BA0131]
MKESIILAVDGGATKTTLTIRSIQGNCIFEKTTSGCNYQTIGVDAATELLSHLLHSAYLSTKLETIHAAVFAMAGIDTKSDLQTVTHIIKQSLQGTPFHIEELVIENDVQAALVGLVENQPGALLISGTGSIIFGTDGKGYIVRAGGWGHRASDEGSGYWIGRQILKAVFRAEEGLEKPTILKKLVFEKLQIHSIDQLVTWLYQVDYTNAQTASIASVLKEAVSLGDKKAIHISEIAAEELFLLVKAMLTKLHYEDKGFTLYLNGGILKHDLFIQGRLRQLIHQTYPQITISLCEDPPVEDIVRRAKYALKNVALSKKKPPLH